MVRVVTYCDGGLPNGQSRLTIFKGISHLRKPRSLFAQGQLASPKKWPHVKSYHNVGV